LQKLLSEEGERKTRSLCGLNIAPGHTKQMDISYTLFVAHMSEEEHVNGFKKKAVERFRNASPEKCAHIAYRVCAQCSARKVGVKEIKF
jgi:hypothetical protein